MRKMGRFLIFLLATVSTGWRVLRIKIELTLVSQQVTEQRPLGRGIDHCVDAQEHCGIGQQSHAPSQAQAIEKGSVQTQLVFLIRLRRFNPATDLCQQFLRRQTGQRQQTEQSFVLTGCKRKLAWTGGGFPAMRTTVGRFGHAKPLQVLLRSVLQPTQGLTLVALGLVPRHVGRNQPHVRTQSGQHGNIPTSSTKRFEFGGHIAHIRHDDFGPPLPSALTVMQAGRQQSALEKVGRRDPTHQGHQQNRRLMLAPPQSQCVFFVTHIPATLAGLERALSHAGAMGGISFGLFFLKPSHAASKSVASINATAWGQRAARWIKVPCNWLLIRRKPPTPTSARNWWSMRASGIRSRWDKRANERQARCSASKVNTWLIEWAGVRTVNKCVRHSWAAPKDRRGPRAGRTFQCSLIKLSGIKGSTSVNNAAVPVIGSFDFIAGQPTLWEPLRLPKHKNDKLLTQNFAHQQFTSKLVTPSNQGQGMLRFGTLLLIRAIRDQFSFQTNRLAISD